MKYLQRRRRWIRAQKFWAWLRAKREQEYLDALRQDEEREAAEDELRHRQKAAVAELGDEGGRAAKAHLVRIMAHRIAQVSNVGQLRRKPHSSGIAVVVSPR